MHRSLRFVFNVIGAACLILGVGIAVAGKQGEAISVLVGALLLFFANLERVRKIKLPGFSAETHEVVEEARSAIEQMRVLARTHAKILLDLLHGAGRYGGANKDETAVEAELRENLLALGLDQSAVADVFTEETRAAQTGHRQLDRCCPQQVAGGQLSLDR